MSHLPYTTYAEYLSRLFPDAPKVQKLGVSIGTTCPNRDGTIGSGGCIYCNNASFTPDYRSETADVTATLLKGKDFFARKYPAMKYLAYFQSYTNTHGMSIDRLMEAYRTAAAVDDVVGIIIGTRPDCVPDELLDRLSEMNHTTKVIMEYGAESSHDTTLHRVNRCHTWSATVDAVRRSADRGLDAGLHFIMGLPGESRNMMLETVDRAIQLPISSLKFHQLQIIRGTRLEREYADGVDDIRLFDVNDYIDLCADIVSKVPRHIAIERFVSQSPDALLVAPRWNLKNYQFTNLLNNRLFASRSQKACCTISEAEGNVCQKDFVKK